MKKAALIAALLFVANQSYAVVIDFEDIDITDPLTWVQEQYAGYGLHVSADNNNGSHPDEATVYNTDGSGGRDDDLEFSGGWAGGNASDETFGKALIISENYNTPDDEARGGSLYLDFDSELEDFAFSVIDIDDSETAGFIRFSNSGGDELQYAFSDFSAGAGSDVSHNSAVFGNRTANRMDAIDLSGYGFTDVEFYFKNSGAIGDVAFTTVPEPSAFSMIGLGLFGLAGFASRRKKK
jgi:hypothetical protein